jgi:lysosomal acid lipase/cholesteryl ester hydrolase
VPFSLYNFQVRSLSVWLGNLRGNTYSRYHETLSETDIKFWDFSWDEMAEYDLPAMIDYIYDVKSQEDKANFDHDLLYVGHSMGGTIFYAMMATKLEYNTKVRAAFLLAPVTYMAGLKAIYTWVAPLAKPIQVVEYF